MNLTEIAAAGQQLLQSLLGPLTQGQRLVRLHTPLGADVLVAERLTVLDAIAPLTADNLPEGTPDAWADNATGLRLEVDALAQDGHLELKRLVGQTARVELLTAQGLRSWHAVISRAAFLGGDGGLTRYRLTLEPWLALLAHRVDSFVFQDLTVPEILDAVFQDHVGQNLGGGGGIGQIVPQWRWDLADPAAYPRRSLCIQHAESDLDFVLRLCREEGIAFWFEHSGSDDNAAHTLVLSDHAGAYRANPEPTVRHTGLNQKSGSPFQDDSLQRVFERRRAYPQALHWLSRDHRSTQLRPVQALGAGKLPIVLTDLPGAYAYPSQVQGQRLLDRQLEALQGQACLSRAAGPWRQAAPGSTVRVAEHPRLRGDKAELLITATLHRARNNVSADALAGLQRLSGATGVPSDPDDEPLHHAELLWIPAGQAYRAPAIGPADGQTQRFKRPTVHGLQTAIVVGDAGEVIHTDRDHRIKIQFHWQRGAQSSHRLAHPSGDDNAPANDQTGTWVRVASAVAGANWGAVAVPRVGQEVVVAFTDGDIDRPVVIGSAYNAPGQSNAQGATVTQGAAHSHGASPAWFPGDQSQGEHQAHAHPQVLAGIKTQELTHSATGGAEANTGHNQLVLDDTPGSARLELSTTQHATRLQLGSLIHQDDNRRLDLRGHGFDLATTAHGAVRAGSGLLVSSHAKPSSASGGHQLDSREPQAQLDQAQDLLHTLAHSAQAHQAKGGQEPALPQAPASDSPALPNQQGLKALAKSLQATQQRPGGGDEAFGGGTGTVPAWSRPDLLLASPSAIASFTPAHSILSAGTTSTTVAGQDLQRIAQGQMVSTVKGDVTLYTYGRASNSNKSTQTTGIQLHAASGSVHLSALKSTLSAVADKQVSVSSTQGMVKVLAPKHVLLTAAGSALKLEPGKITLMTEGKVEFKASKKVLTSAGGGSGAVTLREQSELKDCEWKT
jgi:type VI secretion system secreted protein VgrG